MKPKNHRLSSPFLQVARITWTLGLAVAGLGMRSAQASSATWNGATNTIWATGTDWSADPVPANGDTATFNGAGNGNATISLGSGVMINNILFDTSSAAAYTIGSGAVGRQALTLGD